MDGSKAHFKAKEALTVMLAVFILEDVLNEPPQL